MNTTLSALVISTTLMSACIGGDCVKGTGDPVKKDLQLDAVRAITVQGSIDVRVVQGATQSVTVEGQENVIALVNTSVKNGQWTVNTSKCYRTDKPFIVHLTVPSLEAIRVEGSADVTGTGTFEAERMELSVQGSGDIDVMVKAEQVKADVQGSGDIKLAGSCEQLDADIQGSGDIKAVGLTALNAKASVQGSGDITVHVTGDLKATVFGSGDIRYKGQPSSIDRTVNGSGDVEQLK